MGAEVAIGATVLGTVMGMEGQRRAASSQSDAFAAQERAARRNAALAKRQAEANAAQQEMQADRIIASTEAGFAAAGVSGGTVMNVIQDSVMNAEMDRQSILLGGDIRSESFLNQAGGFAQAGASVRSASTFNMLAAGLGGIAQVASMKK